MSAGADPPPSPWKEAYLAGLRHEEAGQWGLASAAFERARLLRPEPEAGVDFGPAGTLAYDPYFHLARLSDAPGLTASSVFLGTAAYAAPETISGVPADHRQDLYALGLVLFELLQGRAPHAGSSPLEQLRAHFDGRFPTRDELERPVPEPVWELLSDLVARNPDDRPASAQQVLVRLRDLIRRVEEGTL